MEKYAREFLGRREYIEALQGTITKWEKIAVASKTKVLHNVTRLMNTPCSLCGLHYEFEDEVWDRKEYVYPTACDFCVLGEATDRERSFCHPYYSKFDAALEDLEALLDGDENPTSEQYYQIMHKNASALVGLLKRYLTMAKKVSNGSN